MISTLNEIRVTLESRLREAGLSEFVDRDRSQFLDLGGEVFVELVLTDASRLEDAKRVVEAVADEMKSRGASLDSVVRALWEVVSVQHSGTSRTTDLAQYRAAEEFRITLRSGTRQCGVIMDVTWGAMELLEHKLGLKEGQHQRSLPPGHVAREMVAPIVRKFIEQNLARGGTSYWDPLHDFRIELTSTDMSFLMGQSTAFEELRQAISDAFDPSVVESFLGSLSVSGIRLHDFDAVLPDISNMLGGAYKRGETFSTSATELYRKLDRTEQELLRRYFLGKVAYLSASPSFGDLAKKYAGTLETSR